MTSSQTHPTILHADQEHAGLRTAVFVALFVFLVAAFFGIQALLAALGAVDYAFVASCGLALPVALGVVWVLEKLLKRYWPSGRSVTLIRDGIQLQTETDTRWEITRAHEPVPLFWYFNMLGWQRGGRERRVPRSWLCLAAQLKSGKKEAVVYTFLPRNKARTWLSRQDDIQFHEISPREVYDNSLRARIGGPSRPEIPAAVLTGKDGEYWLAERRRWTEGFELPAQEFELFMNHIQTTLEL
ncbi:MAG: hypothetical protein IPM53_09795 [Anaerolineaceae bacterium]|nr:hypothetical protein [Anaerolineaceae bacterium]